MIRTFKALVLIAGVSTVGLAHAFTVAPLTKAQQKLARAEIKAQLPAGTKVKSIKFSFGPTPSHFIGSGFEHATVKAIENGHKTTLKFTVAPGANGGVKVWE